MASQVLFYAMQQDFPERTVTRLLTDRITSFHSNTGKKDFLKVHFGAVLGTQEFLSHILDVQNTVMEKPVFSENR